MLVLSHDPTVDAEETWLFAFATTVDMMQYSFMTVIMNGTSVRSNPTLRSSRGNVRR